MYSTTKNFLELSNIFVFYYYTEDTSILCNNLITLETGQKGSIISVT